MLNDKPTEATDPRVLYGWRLSDLFKNPEHIPDVLKWFGPLPQSTLREIIEALDMMALNWGAAHGKKWPMKFVDAEPKLQRLEKWLSQAQKEWDGLAPLHTACVRLAIEGVPRTKRKTKARSAAKAINLSPVIKNILPILRHLRDPEKFSAAHGMAHQKFAERVFLWEPLLQLMHKHQANPGQRGSEAGAIRSLHRSLGIDPQDGTVRKMLHDRRQAARPKN
jgi:hypothetical protein